MSTTSPPPAAPPSGRSVAARPVRRRPWGKLVLYAFGVVLIAGGAWPYVARWLAAEPGARITRKILPDLRPEEFLAAQPGVLKDWNVLLITLDTTRADHLGCYGNRGVKTPTYDRLARSGVLFSNAITTVPATLPAHSSLLTGLYPIKHGARANGTFRLEERNETLPEALRASGYKTAAAISAYVLDQQYGLAQGFDFYHDDLTRGVKYAPNMYRERAAELTNEAIIPWLREHGRDKFFCWIHYFDAHAVYLPPEPYRSDYADDLYSGEIAYADSQAARVLDVLAELGVAGKTLVIVTADHGEGLGEHNEETHSLLIYDTTMHIPLIMSAPGALPQGVVINGQVGLVDLMPTVLDLLGIQSGLTFDGVSLLGARPPAPRPMYIETMASMLQQGWAPLLGVRSEQYKYILAPRPELYDIRNDPKELHNLFDPASDVFATMHDQLQAFAGEDPLVAAQARGNLVMDPESRAKLAALGYISAAAEEPPAGADALMDPKDGILHWTTVQSAVGARDKGDIKRAIEILEVCIQKVPRDVFARSVLAGAYATYGKYDEALALLTETERLAPNDDTVALAKAGALLALYRLDEAEQAIQRGLQLNPANSGGYSELAQIAMLRRDEERAFELLAKALELDNGARRSSILKQQGDYHLRRGERELARAAYEQALATDEFFGDARAGLAELDIADGKLDSALENLRQAIRFNPVQPRALAAMSDVLSQQGRFDEALRAANQALEMSPTFPTAFVSLGLAYRRKEDFTKAEETYRAGLIHAPRHDGLHQNLAQVLLRQGRTADAIESFRAALRNNRFNTVAMVNIGVDHLRAGRKALAARFFVRALRINPAYALAHKHLGVLLLREGQNDAAAFHLQRSLELDPNQPEAGKLRFQLDEFRARGVTTRPYEPTPEDLSDDLPIDSAEESPQ